MEEVMVAADDLEMTKLFVSRPCIAHEAHAVVMCVRQAVDDGVASTVVGVFPVVQDVFDAEAELVSEILRAAVVAHHGVGGAVDMQHPDRSHGCHVGVRTADESADRCRRVYAVAMSYRHAVAHETAHREAGEEHAVMIDRIFHRETVEESHQEAVVVGGARGQSGVPHGAIAFVESLRDDHHPFKLISDLLEMELVVETCDIVAEAVQEEQNRHRPGVFRSLHKIFSLHALPFEVLNLRKAFTAKEKYG